ncbi:recombinase family protein [Phaeospirillum tilakii]|uniref:recombinase family protein n=1 Tax=Phaeospirillum tilakii TaxID=741673 RepID=UPI003A94960B
MPIASLELIETGDAMLIGYARSSTLEQVAGIEAQIRDLQAAGCEKVFAEQVVRGHCGSPAACPATRLRP